MKDYDKLVECLKNKDCRQVTASSIFESKPSFKHMLFNSKLLMVVDKDLKTISKMFCILTPESNGVVTSSHILGMYLDDKFFKDSIKLIESVLENELCTKYKIIVESRNQYLKNVLLNYGFVEECNIDRKGVSASTLSYFR